MEKEYNFMIYCYKKVSKSKFTKKDLVNIYEEFKKFIEASNINELDILRSGEILLGELGHKDFSDINYVKSLLLGTINNLISDASTLNTPVAMALLGTITKLALAQVNNELINYNNYKEENKNDL